jgi:hypothetical protein
MVSIALAAIVVVKTHRADVFVISVNDAAKIAAPGSAAVAVRHIPNKQTATMAALSETRFMK